MIRAIDDYKISGVATTLPFGKYVMQHEAFLSGNFDTKFIETYFTPDALRSTNAEEEKIAALLAAQIMEAASEQKSAAAISTTEQVSKWKERRRYN